MWMLGDNNASCCADCADGAGSCPGVTQRSRWRLAALLTAGAAVLAGAVYFATRPLPMRLEPYRRRRSYPTLELPDADETMEEVVWEQRR